MVCEQNDGVGHDFTADPLRLQATGGGWLKARRAAAAAVAAVGSLAWP